MLKLIELTPLCVLTYFMLFDMENLVKFVWWAFTPKKIERLKGPAYPVKWLQEISKPEPTRMYSPELIKDVYVHHGVATVVEARKWTHDAPVFVRKQKKQRNLRAGKV